MMLGIYLHLALTALVVVAEWFILRRWLRYPKAFIWWASISVLPLQLAIWLVDSAVKPLLEQPPIIMLKHAQILGLVHAIVFFMFWFVGHGTLALLTAKTRSIELAKPLGLMALVLLAPSLYMASDFTQESLFASDGIHYSEDLELPEGLSVVFYSDGHIWKFRQGQDQVDCLGKLCDIQDCRVGLARNGDQVDLWVVEAGVPRKVVDDFVAGPIYSRAGLNFVDDGFEFSPIQVGFDSWPPARIEGDSKSPMSEGQMTIGGSYYHWSWGKGIVVVDRYLLYRIQWYRGIESWWVIVDSKTKKYFPITTASDIMVTASQFKCASSI